MRGLIAVVLMACASTIAGACDRASETVPGVAAVSVTVKPARVEAGGRSVLSSPFTVANTAGTLPADQWVFVHALDDSNELRCGRTTTRRRRQRRTGRPTNRELHAHDVSCRAAPGRGDPPEAGPVLPRLWRAPAAVGRRSRDALARVATLAVAAPTNPVVVEDGWA